MEPSHPVVAATAVAAAAASEPSHHVVAATAVAATAAAPASTGGVTLLPIASPRAGEEPERVIAVDVPSGVRPELQAALMADLKSISRANASDSDGDSE